jgi:hypothetical protein
MLPAEQLHSTVANLLAGRDILNQALRGSVNMRRAREYSLQGLYLVAVRSFEGFLEDQILNLACDKVRWKSRVRNGVRLRWSNRLQERRKEIIKRVILREKDYVDYLPYERTMAISDILFHGGRPFNLLSPSDRTSLVRCQRVRNYIAHRSQFAFEKFIKSYTEIKPVRVLRPNPLHYLDDEIRAGVSLFEHDLIQLLTISRFLS